MTIIDSFTGPSTATKSQDNRHHEETKGAFKALLRDMEHDYLSKQPHSMAESRRASDKPEEVTIPSAVTKKQLEQWQEVADIARLPAGPKQLYATETATSNTSNVAAIRMAVHDNTTMVSSVANQTIANSEPETSTDPVQTIPSKFQRSDSEQTSLLQTSGLHVYATAEGIGLTYRNNQQDTRSGLDQVMQLKKLLAEQGKTVTEAYVNAQRLEFKEKQNGY